MIQNKEKAFFTLFLFAFAALIFLLTLGLGRVARVVPLTVSIPTLIFLGFQLLADLRPGLAQKFSIFRQKDLFQVEPLREISIEQCRTAGPLVNETRAAREKKAFLWLALMLVFIYLFGFLVALPAFSSLYLRRRAKESWRLSLAVGAIIGGILYGIFTLLLKANLYEGLLWGLVRG